MKPVRFFRIGLSASVAALITLTPGLFLLFAPNTSRRLLCMFIGVGLTVYGSVCLVGFLSERDLHAFTPGLLVGVCALAFGVFSLLRPNFLLNFLFTILGVFIAVISAGGIGRALDLKRLGFVRWHIPALGFAVTLLLALSIIFFPELYGNLLMRVVGLLLALEGAADLFLLHRLNAFVGDG